MGLLHSSLYCFNSTMVRLKVGHEFGQFCAHILFQFHYGTIKRWPQPWKNASAETCFNSTMVRLKGRSEHFLYARIQGFNSTMVRLKDTLRPEVLDPCVFQFHYGTIKSKGVHFYVHRKKYVSIPLWYD